jgi:hypothetical protein
MAEVGAPPYPEPRWPALVSVLIVILIGAFPAGGIEAWIPITMIAVLAAWTLISHRWHVQLGYANSTISTLVLAYGLFDLVRDLVESRKTTALQLLGGALILWTMNILVFATWYWRLDAGGPHRRSHHKAYRDGAFLFPQLTLPHDRSQPDWRPQFVDYLFLSFNTSTAFSPTDVPVLSRWAKVLMMVQSSISLTTLAIIAARAVNTLN